MSKDFPVALEVVNNYSLANKNANLSKGEAKNRKLHIKNNPEAPRLKKPSWIRSKVPTNKKLNRVSEIRNLLRENNLNSVCEEASCPNLAECFSHGTATFMIMGNICTRKCPFCDVAHGRPKPLNIFEPTSLALAIQKLNLNYVVITSVDRDDLKDGGANHFSECIKEIRKYSPNIKIEILTPDFRHCEVLFVDIMKDSLPDVFNHNLETVPRLYAEVRPGANYQRSLDLIKLFKSKFSKIPTKSGIMVGLGETKQEVFNVLDDLAAHDATMLTIGQYLQPSKFHLSVKRYVSLEEFKEYANYAKSIGFANIASGPMVRSSYHADLQASGIAIS